jgi:hypothetical protein
MISSFIIRYLGWQAGIRVVLAQTATIRPLGCSRKMRPLAFLDPSAFLGTNPTGELITVKPVTRERYETLLACLFETAKCRDAFKAWASELPQLRVPAFALVRKRSIAAGAVENMKRVRLLQAFHEIEVGQNTVIAIQARLAVRRDKDGTNAAYAC